MINSFSVHYNYWEVFNVGKINNLDAKNAYYKIKGFKDKSGKYYKTLFHLHTPESYDYELFKGREGFSYQQAGHDDLYNICVEKGILPSDSNYASFNKVGVDEGIYNTYKEAFSFLLLVNELAISNIDIAVITDHNTIDGYNKMDRAIANLKHLKGKYYRYPTILLGIEVSCADNNHVVGIFDKSNEKCIDKLRRWLDFNVYSFEAGTVLTSMEVMKFFYSIGAFTYIAHLNSADMIQKSHYLSGAYKKEILNSKYCKIVGCSSIDKIDKLKSDLWKYSPKKEYKFIIDNDSHCLEDVNKNQMWLKGSSKNLQMLKEALFNYDISVSLDFEYNTHKRQYISGMYIQNNDAFLVTKKGQKKDGFVIKYSQFLNCLIGGRGTGKSTVIKFMEYILNQNCESLEMLNFICSHGHMWLLYVYEEEEYIIEMQNPTKEKEFTSNSDILSYFDINRREYYSYKPSDFKDNIVKKYAYEKNLSIYRVNKKNNNIILISVDHKKKYLDKFFDTSYSVNQLVNTASSEKMNSFIFSVMFNNNKLKNANNIIRIRSVNGLAKLMIEAENILRERKKQVMQVIDEFNKKMNKKNEILRIVYDQNQFVTFPEFAIWLGISENRLNSMYKINNVRYNIKNKNVIDFLEMLFDKYGLFEFFNKMIDGTISEDSILDYTEEKSFETINSGYTTVTRENEKDLLSLISNKIIRTSNITNIRNYLRNYIENKESFSIEFNINSKTGIQGVNFKDIRVLSLGQKVVAMIDFILGYSEYSGDFRPLIIDQPEDNLDNQYIYINLVKQFRDTKEKRQIILATHSSTIVTNSMSDLVCVMDSNGENGWIRKYGYPGNKVIKKEIINCLEGGLESFEHKLEIYKEVLNINI